MKLTPLEVRKQEFNRQMRGYDQDEVRSFLESVADEYEAVAKDRQELAKQLESLQKKLREYQQMETNLQDAAVNATRAAREAEERSSREAELLLQQAHLEVDQILSDGRRKREQILDDIARLEGQRRSFILTLKHVLHSQVDLLEVLERDPLQTSWPAIESSPETHQERSPRDQSGTVR